MEIQKKLSYILIEDFGRKYVMLRKKRDDVWFPMKVLHFITNSFDAEESSECVFDIHVNDMYVAPYIIP